MNIGKLIEQDGSVSGYISTLDLDINFNLVQNPEKTKENHPDYLITAGKVELGSCWKNSSPRTGEVYYSLEMDDPSFPQKLKCAAFKNQDGTWRVVWDRQQPKQAADQEAA